MVPIVAIFFAVLAAVPALEEFRIEIKGFVFDNLMPASGDTFAEYFDGFIANTGKMTGFGIIGLGSNDVDANQHHFHGNEPYISCGKATTDMS